MAKTQRNMNLTLAENVHTVAHCWKITRTDGTVVACTDHSENIVVAGVTYKASSGIMTEGLTATHDLSGATVQASAYLDVEAVGQAALRAGLFEGASVDVMLVDYTTPARYMYLAKDWRWGQTTIRDNDFEASIHSKTQRLNTTIGKAYSKTCRALLGDADCGVVPTAANSSVTAAATAQSFVCSTMNSATEGLYDHGVIVWTSGHNSGTHGQIHTFDNDTKVVVLKRALAYEPAAGDNFTYYWGCDKTIETCSLRFGNTLNFRGEPYVPSGQVALSPSREPPPVHPAVHVKQQNR